MREKILLDKRTGKFPPQGTETTLFAQKAHPLSSSYEPPARVASATRVHH